MAIRFDLFRLSLLPREQMDILNHPDPTREEYLKKVFSASNEFEHYGTIFHYVPSDTSNEIVGRVGRSVIMDENLPPEVGLEESKHESWKAAVLIIDPKEHGDGQKIALEYDPRVGHTHSIISSFVQTINKQNPTAAYHIEVVPISEANTFWQFAEENKGRVTMLSFNFVAPNMFGGIDNITEEMRQFRDQEKAQKVQITLRSDDGIETSTDKIRNAVTYTTRGGGQITARAKGNKKYSSKQTTSFVKLDENRDEPLILRVARNISKVLGRE